MIWSILPMLGNARRGRLARFAAAGLVLLGLTVAPSCGGGGGGGTTPPTPPPTTTAPSITTQPSNQTVMAGQTATFTVSASGIPTPTTQWQRSSDGGTTWADVTTGAGGTTGSYTTAATGTGDSGAKFHAVASNGVGSPATSAMATLTVIPLLSIATQPSPATFTVGQTATLSVVAAGGMAPLHYQWKQGSTNVGTDNATLSIPSVQLSNAGSYSVTVTDSASTPQSIISNAVILTVIPFISIAAQPFPAIFTVGQTATLNVVAAGGMAPLHYQWKQGGTSVGTDNATLTIPSVQLTHAGSYTVTITDSASTPQSVVGNAVALTVIQLLSITTQPSPASFTVGQMATLSVVATGGSAPLHYQWKQGITNVGTDNATLSIPSVQLSHAGSYTVTITDSASVPQSITSTAVTLTVNASIPFGAVLPVQLFIPVTKEATLTPTLSGGTAPYTYAWTKDGVAIPGATGSSFTIPSLRLLDQAVYAVTVRDVAGASTTATSKLFVATTADMPSGLNPVGVAVLGNDVFLTSPGQNILLKLNRYSTTPQVIPVAGGPTA